MAKVSKKESKNKVSTTKVEDNKVSIFPTWGIVIDLNLFRLSIILFF